jgi:hypothetical protein
MALPKPAGFDEPRVNLLIADDVGLGKTIEAGLAEPEYVQLALFSESERGQNIRNVAVLEARRPQIPGEIEQETALTRARYADPQPRLFTVAVTFLEPERLG